MFCIIEVKFGIENVKGKVNEEQKNRKKHFIEMKCF